MTRTNYLRASELSRPKNGRSTWFKRGSSKFASSGSSLLGFVLASFIGALSPLIVIPSVINGWGPEGWAAIAVGQSIGAVGSVVVMWGWAVQGPVLAARARSIGPVSLLVGQSLTSRIPIACFVVPIVGVVSFLLAPEQKLSASLTSVGFALSGLTMAWFFIGVRKPRLVLLYDSLPKLLIAVLGAMSIYLFDCLIIYPIILIVVTVVFNALSAIKIIGSPCLSIKVFRLKRVRRSMESSAGAGVSQLASAVYINGSVAIVALFATQQTIAEFAALNRLYLAAILGTLPVFQFFAGWVANDDVLLGRRARFALLIQLSMSCAALPAFVLLFPLVSNILFGDEIFIDSVPILLTGFGVAVVVVTRAVGSHVLLANDASRQLGVSAVTGAALAIVLVSTGAKFFGVSGAAGGLLLVECAVLLVQVFYVVVLVRRDSRRG